MEGTSGIRCQPCSVLLFLYTWAAVDVWYVNSALNATHPKVMRANINKNYKAFWRLSLLAPNIVHLLC